MPTPSPEPPVTLKVTEAPPVTRHPQAPPGGSGAVKVPSPAQGVRRRIARATTTNTLPTQPAEGALAAGGAGRGKRKSAASRGAGGLPAMGVGGDGPLGKRRDSLELISQTAHVSVRKLQKALDDPPGDETAHQAAERIIAERQLGRDQAKALRSIKDMLKEPGATEQEVVELARGMAEQERQINTLQAIAPMHKVAAVAWERRNHATQQIYRGWNLVTVLRGGAAAETEGYHVRWWDCKTQPPHHMSFHHSSEREETVSSSWMLLDGITVKGMDRFKISQLLRDEIQDVFVAWEAMQSCRQKDPIQAARDRLEQYSEMATTGTLTMWRSVDLYIYDLHLIPDYLPHLRRLSVEFHPQEVSAQGWLALAEMTQRLNTLALVSYPCFGAGFGGSPFNQHIPDLARACAEAPALRELRLMGCDLTSATLRPFAEAAGQSRSLASLCLAGNRLSCDAVPLLLDALERNAELTDLQLQDNRIFADGALALRLALQRNSTLRRVDIRKNPHQREDALAQCVVPAVPPGWSMRRHPHADQGRRRRVVLFFLAVRRLGLLSTDSAAACTEFLSQYWRPGPLAMVLDRPHHFAKQQRLYPPVCSAVLPPAPLPIGTPPAPVPLPAVLAPKNQQPQADGSLLSPRTEARRALPQMHWTCVRAAVCVALVAALFAADAFAPQVQVRAVGPPRPPPRRSEMAQLSYGAAGRQLPAGSWRAARFRRPASPPLLDADRPLLRPGLIPGDARP
eukprot:TRINITY_DN47127_c0_g1_i1.p1 TRINITY_DN47127_c0_g1~~TRINITY_DN47127_c0_g1_i1.p1  ORF type:complete len:739 (+),score=168.03 TRINITY_DN47127_c0_g1_i1:78-2294(+)